MTSRLRTSKSQSSSLTTLNSERSLDANAPTINVKITPNTSHTNEVITPVANTSTSSTGMHPDAYFTIDSRSLASKHCSAKNLMDKKLLHGVKQVIKMSINRWKHYKIIEWIFFSLIWILREAWNTCTKAGFWTGRVRRRWRYFCTERAACPKNKSVPSSELITTSTRMSSQSSSPCTSLHTWSLSRHCVSFSGASG